MARDIFHDGIVKLLSHIIENKFEAKEGVEGYLFNICRNTWITAAKRNKKVVFTDKIVENGSHDGNGLLSLIKKERQEKMDIVFSKLGERCRQLLRLTFYANTPMHEVCEIMGFANTNVAKSTHYKCKKKLSDSIKNNTVIKDLLRN